LTEIVVTDMVPLRLRGQWFDIISGMWSIGSVTGPMFGSAFAQNVNWVGHSKELLVLVAAGQRNIQRWIFHLIYPFVGVLLVLVPLTLKLASKQTILEEQLRHVDWIGSVFFIGSRTSFLVPITWGGVS